MVFPASGVDGLGYDRIQDTTQNPGVLTGKKFKWLGQAGNTVATNTANQGVGSAALPALASAATGTVTITDSLITTVSIVIGSIRRGTTTPAAGAIGAIVFAFQAPAAGSVVVDVANRGSAATLSTDYVIWYWVIN